MLERSAELLQASPHHRVARCQSTSSGHHLRNRNRAVKIPGSGGGNVFVEKQHCVPRVVGEDPAGSGAQGVS